MLRPLIEILPYVLPVVCCIPVAMCLARDLARTLRQATMAQQIPSTGGDCQNETTGMRLLERPMSEQERISTMDEAYAATARWCFREAAKARRNDHEAYALLMERIAKRYLADIGKYKGLTLRMPPAWAATGTPVPQPEESATRTRQIHTTI